MPKTAIKKMIKTVKSKSKNKPLKSAKKTMKKMVSNKPKKSISKPNRQEVILINLLKEMREKNGLSQDKVAKRMDKSVSNISTLESTKTPSSPSIRSVFEYAKAIGCQLDFSLINLKEEKIRDKMDKQKSRHKEMTKKKKLERAEQREFEMDAEFA